MAVAETGNVTRAAQSLHIAQPSLSAAIKQLEQQLGVELLARYGRRVTVTAAGDLLPRRGRELLNHADAVAAEVRGQDAAASGRLRLGVSPTARYGVAPELLAACAAQAPAVMLYTTEDTTGALLRDVADGGLDLAITFCAPAHSGVELALVREEPAIVHLPADDHPLGRSRVTDPPRAPSWSPPVTTQAASLPACCLRSRNSGFVELLPPLGLPFHLASRAGATGAPVGTVQAIARGLAVRTTS